MLALAGTSARLWEPKKLRTRLSSTAARLTRHARQLRLRYDQHHPWSPMLAAGLERLTAYPAPG